VFVSHIQDGRLLPGAGAVEVELSSQIAKFGDTCPGLEQYSIKKFAEALEVFPRTLAQNSGLNVTKSIAALVAAHDEGKANFGLNIKVCCIQDSFVFDCSFFLRFSNNILS
jgi:T-complex protein 1 subunit theta